MTSLKISPPITLSNSDSDNVEKLFFVFLLFIVISPNKII
ncbi:streptococcal invasion locus signaling peptide SilC [Streptococcus dysgalactiae subsp. equisimilis]|uniref:SilC n=3 Tax=Streptococcus TaxID=1301 RepID=T1YTP0_STREQ|nr:SilC [Streptococcus pyogenes]AGU68253.1 SilC [Streptococcus dysgalactiae subsp. equisimilis]ACT32353.1 SilC [Streptococcus pyogenes]ACT32371.1 SilC [Streptococcus pyogenes]ASU10862.1 SilC [Streptococcus dysgalactiae subsp. equisimilis]